MAEEVSSSDQSVFRDLIAQIIYDDVLSHPSLSREKKDSVNKSTLYQALYTILFPEYEIQLSPDMEYNPEHRSVFNNEHADLDLLKYVTWLGFHVFVVDQDSDMKTKTRLYYNPIRSQINYWLLVRRIIDERLNTVYQIIPNAFTSRKNSPALFEPNNLFYFPSLQIYP